ncbi:uncharacterized protein LOC118231629 isoform X2 [Anguilla anguilla]|uniref:uncharacterized protein LOC118231629 isoform X2 n=1 Tax=Anguilla anguilla TaxID=7936 RepID=UPI0015ACE420|nr:uncharacterized protein LOC118231629 isoform X2 [Anguilla anguilla]
MFQNTQWSCVGVPRLSSAGGGLVLGLCLWLCAGVWGDVGHFSTCPQFFYGGTPPSGLGGQGYAQICQRYRNQHRFASLYHRQNRAPLYSAYLVTVGTGRRPPAVWKYEPQLATSRAGPEMQPLPKNGSVDQNVLESQAVLKDYAWSNYTKGHLNPSMHHSTREDQKATFTLTNVVPQRLGSNSGPWAMLERAVWARLGAYCTGPAYVVTGALPYAARRQIANRVGVPEYLWTAYCCPAFNSTLPAELRPFFPAYAAIGRNDRLSDDSIVPVDPGAKRSVRGYNVRPMPLETMESHLRERLGGAVSVFQNGCRQDTPEPTTQSGRRHDTPEPTTQSGHRHDTPKPTTQSGPRQDTPEPTTQSGRRHDTAEPATQSGRCQAETAVFSILKFFSSLYGE